MAKTAVAIRLTPEFLEWADSYAAARGVSRQVLLESGLDRWREDCESGVPELRAAARAQSAVKTSEGVGECPKSKGGHVWEMVDGVRRCKYCRKPGRAFLAEFGAARAEMFSRLRVPMVSGSGKAPGSK